MRPQKACSALIFLKPRTKNELRAFYGQAELLRTIMEKYQ